jgi:hypothetical protein
LNRMNWSQILCPRRERSCKVHFNQLICRQHKCEFPPLQSIRDLFKNI